MIYSVKFNGVELGEIIDILQDFTPSMGVDWSPELIEASGTCKGSEFVYTTYKSKAIPMPFTMTDDLEEKHDKLMEILNVDEPKPLVFESVPDRVFYAIPSGDLDFSEEGPLGEGTITWIIPDGVAHATTEKSFQAEANDNGDLEVTVVNNGTEAVPVSYEISHNHENGYIGIVSEYGAIQLGKVQEADGENYQQNEVLIDGLQPFLDAPDDYGVNYMHPDHDMGGSLSSIDDSAIVIGSMGNGQPGKWCGGMKTITIPADSESEVGASNFYCYLNWWFETGLMGQTAEQSIAFLTADNKVICGYSLYKSDMTGNTAHLEYWLNGKMIRDIAFTPSMLQSQNPYDNARGHQDIMKEGDTVRYYWWGSYPCYSDPAIKDMVCTKIQIAFTQYYGRNLGDQYVTRNSLRSLRFQKMNVEKWRDVPNRYAAGDVITIDGETTKIYRDGMNITGDEITGSKYFLVPPGETKVQFFFSDFSEPKPTVKAKIREAFL